MTDEALPHRLLRDHVDAGAPARELFVAKLFVVCTTCSVLIVTALSPPAARALIISNLAFFLIPIAYHVALIAALRRGWWSRAIPWVNTLLQISMLALPFYDGAHREGTSFLTNSALPLGWASLVTVTAMRANPLLSVMAGIIVAGEYLAALTIAYDTAPTGRMITTAAFFVLTGAIAAGVASYLVRQAQDALRAVRSQDLMGKYFMHERLGAGGMAEVYRATYSPEGGFEKIVAVKRVLPAVAAAADGSKFVEMFREEARLCAQLSHPNVVQVFDAGRFGGHYVLTMEFVDGVSLHRALRTGGPVPVAAIAYVGAELAAALDYIHARVDADGRSLGLVHRDVNPPNVLVSKLGEVKLADFGIAHAVNRASLDPDRVYGKYGYLAPEQVRADAIDGRADLFALGLALYEMVTGKPLFRGANPFEVLEFHHPGGELGDRIPSALRDLISELLAVAPEQRPPTGAVVRARLLALSGDAAPYPAGQLELARMVSAALAQPGEAPPVDPTASTVIGSHKG